ncbi:MAG: thioredoxin [Gemmatimonadetes bacterium]|nr:thioredoxin [Gemmatimonadota bacterium]
MSSATITELSDATFAEEIEQYPGIAVVDFWAAWCGPCRAIAPILEELALEYAEQVKVAKLNVDANALAAERFGIRSIPTLLFFRGGQIVDRVVGLLPKPALEARFRAASESPAACSMCS